MRASILGGARRAGALLLAGVGMAGCAGDGGPGGAPAEGPEDPAARAAVEATRVRSVETDWNSETLYFLLLDRFRNGDPSNDTALGRARDGAPLRSFLGGDLKGVLEAIESGYFESLGVDALWMTPFHEQIHGFTDEGTGKTYGFHGYWARDWTRVDPVFGTAEDLKSVVDAAHARGIRVVMDAVLQHTGPVTPDDPVWPEDWVRTEPQCRYESYTTTVDCTLVANLPDLRTDSDEPVDLPPGLVAKWEAEGRLEDEVAELDAWFAETGYPRAPRYYVIKWLTDWVREFGFDGYRVDTAKHFEEGVSVELGAEGARAFDAWKAANPGKAVDDRPFWYMAEVYNYDIENGRMFDFGDVAVDYFAHGYDALINFGFKTDVADGAPAMEETFAGYAQALREGDLRGFGVVNYVSSHDDSGPYDRDREDPLGAGTRLLLAPGTAQIYYGDEVARPLRVEGAEGDANLRSFLEWDGEEPTSAGAAGYTADEILTHWRTLGRFRQAHPAVGIGAHTLIQAQPYVFSRVLEGEGAVERDRRVEGDRVVVGLELPTGPKVIPVGDVFAVGQEVRDAYSGVRGVVEEGAAGSDGAGVRLDTEFSVVLLEVGGQP